MKQEYIKQHVVPKCYLDRFAEHNNGKYIIGTRTITNDGKVKLFERSTADVGYIKNYYDVTDKEDPKYWEHFLAKKIDALCDRPLGSIITSITLAGEGYNMSDDDKGTLSSIIIAQMLRVPASFDYVTTSLYPRIAKEVKEEFYSTFPKEITQKYKSKIDGFQMSKQIQKDYYLNYIFDNDNFNRFVGILKRRTWVIFVNAIRKDLPFVTSDNPVIVEDLNNRNSIGIFNNGIANPSTCIFFPITPTIAIANYSDKGIFAPATGKLNGKIFMLNESKFIIEKNLLVIDHAHKHSFIPEPLFSNIK